MIDLHAHVLPGLDDGPTSSEQATRLVRAASEAGIRTIVATPHVNHHFGVRAPQIHAGVRVLSQRLAAAGVSVDILPGAEIALERLIDLTPEELRALTLGGGDCLLVEPPMRRLPGEFEWPIRDLPNSTGLRALIAHPDRCPGFVENPGRLRALLDGGALCQITVDSLLGRNGIRSQAFVVRLLRDGAVHNLATDGHDTVRRPPMMDRGVAALRTIGWSPERIAWLTVEVPRALLGGAPLPAQPA